MPNLEDTFEKLDAVFDQIKDSRLRMRGSSEFKEADKKFEKLTKFYERLKDKGEDYKPTRGELEYLQKGLEDGLELVDAYLDTKKDIDEVDMSVNTLKRVDAMKEAKAALTEISGDVEKQLEERHKGSLEDEAPSPEEIMSQNEDLLDEISEAREGVHFESGAYKDAQEAFEKMSDKWKGLMQDRTPEDTPNPYELEKMKAEIAATQKAIGEYRAKKDDKDLDKNPKTAKRLAAMERASESLDAQMKRIEAWEKDNAAARENQVVTYSSMSKMAEAKEKLIDTVDKRSTISSSEFRRSKEIVKELNEEWKKIEAKGPKHKLTADEVDRLEKLNNELDENCNKYMRKKGGEDLDTYEEVRRDAMGELKNYAATTKGVLDKRKNALAKEANTITNKALSNEGRDMAKDLKRSQTRVNGQRVWFGSKQYKNAMNDYTKSVKKWDKLTKDKPDDYKPSDKELEDAKADLEKTKASIQKYFDRNKKKDLDQHPKRKARMEAMPKAYDNIDKKLKKLDQAIDKRKELEEKEKEKGIIERNTKRKEELKNAKGVDKLMGKAAEAAEKSMARLSQKTEFSKKDLKDAKMAMAAAILESRLKAPGGEKFKEQIPPTREGYEKAVKQIADSKAFKQAMPDSKITPDTCKKMIKDPKAADKLMWNFNTNLIENKKAKEALQKQAEKKIEKKPEVVQPTK